MIAAMDNTIIEHESRATAPDCESASQKTRVLCVDDHRDIRAVMQLVIDAEPDMACVGCIASANTLMDDVSRLSPDIVLMDATMPGKDPFVALRELRDGGSPGRTIVFTAWDKAEIADRARGSGAHGWIVKTADPDVIVDVIRKIAAGGTYFPEM